MICGRHFVIMHAKDLNNNAVWTGGVHLRHTTAERCTHIASCGARDGTVSWHPLSFIIAMRCQPEIFINLPFPGHTFRSVSTKWACAIAIAIKCAQTIAGNRKRIRVCFRQSLKCTFRRDGEKPELTVTIVDHSDLVQGPGVSSHMSAAQQAISHLSGNGQVANIVIGVSVDGHPFQTIANRANQFTISCSPLAIYAVLVLS